MTYESATRYTASGEVDSLMQSERDESRHEVCDLHMI